jgi:cyanate permease
MVAELFQGKHFAAIFGLINIALLGGGAFGPWLAGWIHDQQGSYRSAFMICIAACLFSSYAIFRASPGKVRRVRKA